MVVAIAMHIINVLHTSAMGAALDKDRLKTIPFVVAVTGAIDTCHDQHHRSHWFSR